MLKEKVVALLFASVKKEIPGSGPMGFSVGGLYWPTKAEPALCSNWPIPAMVPLLRRFCAQSSSSNAIKIFWVNEAVSVSEELFLQGFVVEVVTPLTEVCADKASVWRVVLSSGAKAPLMSLAILCEMGTRPKFRPSVRAGISDAFLFIEGPQGVDRYQRAGGTFDAQKGGPDVVP